MHLNSIEITNLRSIKSFKWKPDSKKIRGWHVLLGENGSGKSSIIKSIALCLIGPNDAQYLQQTWPLWVNRQSVYKIITENETRKRVVLRNNFPYIALKIQKHPIDMYSGRGSTGTYHTIEPVIRIHPVGTRNAYPTPVQKSQTIDSERHVWGSGKGWFSASFGPYRRFSGGDPKYLNAYLQNEKAAPHISAFGEDVALGGALQWLMDQARINRASEKKTISLITEVINSDNFLPNKVKLHNVTEEDIQFSDGSNNIIGIELLGDGYRSALSITIELIHQLVLRFGINTLSNSQNQIIIPGVVMIDEVDAHLHPTWQQHIGFWLTKRFPEMQFIVTTHSPLICQAATTVFKLPTPGTDEEGRFLEGVELDRLKFGNILEAYASDAFGKIEQSEEGKEKLKRLADLTRLSWERDLTDAEREEQATLRAIFIASPVGG